MGDITRIREDVNSNERGLIGIGTLIVFIAMVIVAAVASGVLINTATALQGQARDTSRSTMRQVASGIRVLTINGRAASVGEGTRVENIELFVKTRPGSPGINLKNMSIEYVSAAAERHLVMHDNAYATRQDFYDSNSPDRLGDDNFAVVKIKNPSGTDNYMLATPSDMAEIWIDVTAIEGNGLAPSEKVTLALMPDTGFKTYAQGRTPATMASKGVYKLRL